MFSNSPNILNIRPLPTATNDEATLTNLASASFDPAKTVFVSNSLPPCNPALATNQNPGTVDFTSYAPKRIVLEAKANLPSLLLLNDRYDPNWKVWVDGKPEELLRCNYLMRGVQVPAGTHSIEFRFVPSVRMFYISLAAVAVALAFIGFLVYSPRREESVADAPRPAQLAKK